MKEIKEKTAERVPKSNVDGKIPKAVLKAAWLKTKEQTRTAAWENDTEPRQQEPTDLAGSAAEQTAAFVRRQGRKLAETQARQHRQKEAVARAHAADERGVSPKQVECGTLPDAAQRPRRGADLPRQRAKEKAITAKTAPRDIRGVTQGQRQLRTAANETVRSVTPQAQMQTYAQKIRFAAKKVAGGTGRTAVAVRSAIRNFLAGLHSLTAVLAAGAGAVLGIVIVISLVAFVSGSANGIFFAADAPNAASVTVREAVETLTAEYRDKLEEISDTVQHDRQDITANDDVYYIRWQDVLAVFSSYVAGNEQGAPVAALTENQVDKLREIMWAMNAVDYSTHPETTTIETTDEDGNPTTTEITETVLVIELTHKTPDEMAADYHFTTRQNSYLQLLQNPQYEELWTELLGGFAQGGGELMNPDSTRTPTGTLQWPLPVAGTITSQFGHRVDPITGEVSSHTGTDIACAEGTPILAAADGTVTVANGLDSWGGSYGYYIQINHGGGLETLYAHCSSICVTTGQQVQAGEVIGYVGHTGRATGSHLHLEVWVDRSRKDAMSFFNVYNEG
ncbi:M23 family metallopeptidase [Gemmiger sp.]